MEYNTALMLGCLIPSLVPAWTDIYYRKVRNWVTYPMFLLGVSAAIYYDRIIPSLGGAAIVFAILFFIGYLGGIKGGDIKLGTALGVWLGYRVALILLVISGLCMFFYGVYKLYLQDRLKDVMVPFFRGLYLRARGIKGTMFLRKLPEKGISKDGLPYGTIMVAAAWGLWMVFFVSGIPITT